MFVFTTVRLWFFLCIAVICSTTAIAQSARETRTTSAGTAQLQEGSLAELMKSVSAQCAASAASAYVSAAASIPPASAPPMDERNANGLLGDYIGGVYGTGIAAITMIAVFLAWRTSRKIDYRSRTYEVFSRMLETHEEIVSSIQLGDAKGREAVAYILSEFSFVYKLVTRVAATTGWSLNQRIDIAYTYTYYGPQQQTQKILHRYAPADLKPIGDGMMKKTRTGSQRVKGRQFKGHQNRLSHYFRNLFAAYSFVEASKLSTAEKLALGKVLRSKLSNYEQALLALNILSHLGKQWKDEGLVKTHMPVKNIPQHFYSFDTAFDISTQFPEVRFEWQ